MELKLGVDQVLHFVKFLDYGSYGRFRIRFCIRFRRRL